jgi:GGDEF domain-containing protein
MKSSKTFYFWGKGTVVPRCVQRRAARRIIKPENLSALPKEVASYIRFSPITTTWFPLIHRTEIKEILPDALLVKREEGRAKTIALISENLPPEGELKEDVHLVLGDLKGFGKLNKIYGQKIVDWLKPEVFRFIDEQSRKIGFMYTIYGDEIGITTRPGASCQEIASFLGSLPSELESHLSGFMVAELKGLSDPSRELLEADERVKVLGGYFGVDLMVFDALTKDHEQALREIIAKANQTLSKGEELQAELYDPDFNRARIWVPRIAFVAQSINEFLLHKKTSTAEPEELYQKVMQHMNALLKPKKEEGEILQIETILKAEEKETIALAAQEIRKFRKSKRGQLDEQFPLLNKAAFLEFAEGMFGRGGKVMIGKVKVNSYEYQGLIFTSFKGINDRLGSAIGDEAIQLLAYALKQGLPQSFSLARMPVPPDEFMFAVDISKKPFDPVEMDGLLVVMQLLVSDLSEIEVAFEVSLISSEEGDLETLDKISRAEVNITKISLPSGNLIKTFDRDSAEELDQEIKELERAAARRAESALLATS